MLRVEFHDRVADRPYRLVQRHHISGARRSSLSSQIGTRSEFSMTEYVEARYVKFVLREAQAAEPEAASQLVHNLLRDLHSVRKLNDAGAKTLRSIQSLALSFDRRRSLHAHEWEAANEAVDAWCKSAIK